MPIKQRLRKLQQPVFDVRNSSFFFTHSKAHIVWRKQNPCQFHRWAHKHAPFLFAISPRFVLHFLLIWDRCRQTKYRIKKITNIICLLHSVAFFIVHIFAVEKKANEQKVWRHEACVLIVIEIEMFDWMESAYYIMSYLILRNIRVTDFWFLVDGDAARQYHFFFFRLRICFRYNSFFPVSILIIAPLKDTQNKKKNTISVKDVALVRVIDGKFICYIGIIRIFCNLHFPTYDMVFKCYQVGDKKSSTDTSTGTVDERGWPQKYETNNHQK